MVKEPRTYQTNVRLEDSLRAKLEKIAREGERTLSQVIRQALKEFIQRHF
jgi:predicted transcriptional regulator